MLSLLPFRFLRRAVVVVALVAIGCLALPTLSAHASAASSHASVCTSRTWHLEIHKQAGIVFRLALTGSYTPAGTWCETVGASVVLHASKTLAGTLTLELFKASQPEPIIKSSPRISASLTVHASTGLLANSYGWYWVRATWIPAVDGVQQSVSTIQSCHATTGICASVS